MHRIIELSNYHLFLLFHRGTAFQTWTKVFWPRGPQRTPSGFRKCPSTLRCTSFVHANPPPPPSTAAWTPVRRLRRRAPHQDPRTKCPPRRTSTAIRSTIPPPRLPLQPTSKALPTSPTSPSPRWGRRWAPPQPTRPRPPTCPPTRLTAPHPPTQPCPPCTNWTTTLANWRLSQSALSKGGLSWE